MYILAHRGYWLDKKDANSLSAIKQAIDKGYGFESDVRDYCEELVISHNVASEMSGRAEKVFEWMAEAHDKSCFAINIKADGLKDYLNKYIQKYSLNNYFLFDMSVPQMVEFKEMGLNFYTRQSEIEKEPVMYEDAKGVWIDGFWSTDWITEELLEKHIYNKKKICLVSPDLHNKKDYRNFWEKLKSMKIDLGYVDLCTDYPDEAREYFNE